jgi:hypothetical protein
MTPPNPGGMQYSPRLVSVNTHLTAADLGLEVEIRLRQLDGRWLAVANFGAEPEVGIGATARAALEASFATLGRRAASALMADPQLLRASLDLRELA